MKQLVLAAVTFAVGFVAVPVWACGGLFCSSQVTPTPPEPIDQNAERIIFEVDEGVIRAHVNIQYVGPADEFAWVVPAPSVPTVTESSPGLFQALDDATRMQVILPPQEPCNFANSGGESSNSCIGCGGNDESASGGVLNENSDDQPGDSPVTVYAQDYTDNYQYSVIGAENTADLVDWLQDNLYNVSDNMTPVMDAYNGGDTVFLALKLRSDRAASDIVPILMEYEGDRPSIPLQLTAVAAQPHMGILVFIAGETAFAPANYLFQPPDTESIIHDALGVTSYFEWVARESTEREHFFVSEYIGANPIPSQSFDGLRVSGSYVSRYYTRMSPEQMTLDPVFTAAPTLPDRAAVLDLSGNATLLQCGSPIPERLPSACAFNYCGDGGDCTVVGGQVGCFCAAGDVAQVVTGPDGTRRVTCTPAVNDFGITPVAGGAGTEFDPCNGVDCGQGACVLKAGFPTCECNTGAVACLESDGRIACVPAEGAVTFGPGAGNESRGETGSARLDGPRGTAYAGTFWLPFFLGVGLLAGLSLRRRLAR